MADSDAYTNYYEAQLGGHIPVFRGGLQGGAGLGDWFRGMFRFLLPHAVKAGKAFAGSAVSNVMAGKPIVQALHGALTPTLNAVAGDAAPTVQRIVNSVLPNVFGHDQTGNGIALMEGVNGVPVTKRAFQQYKMAEQGYGPTAAKRARKAAPKGKRKAGSSYYNFG